MHDGPDDVRAGGDAASEDQFLAIVLMAAAASDQQCADGPSCRLLCAGGPRGVGLLCGGWQQGGEQEQSEGDMRDCWGHGGRR